MSLPVAQRPKRAKQKATPYAMGYRRALGIPENADLANDPVRWVNDVLGEFVWSKQREILESIRDNRYTAVHSCHDSGKSFVSSRGGCQHLDTKPDPFLVTTAPTWKQVNSILWREMRKAHRKGELRGRINLDAEWYENGDELVAFGRKPADYDQSAFQGIHALNVMVVIDEAGGVPKSIFDAVDSLATNVRARVLAIGNPDDPASHFAEICKPGSGWNVIHIGYQDTPAFTQEEVPDYLYDLLISPEWVDERKKRWGEKSPIYISKVLGLFPEISDDTLLTPGQIKAAQRRDLSEDEKVVATAGNIGVDVARFGDDKTAIYRARHGRVRKIKLMHKADTMETAEFVHFHLSKFPGERAHIDVVGVGGGVYDRLRAPRPRGFGRTDVIEFNSSEKAYDSERFGNRRAEAYWYLRDLADDGALDLPGDGEDDDLAAQLGSIKWKLMGGRIYIESKEDMRSRGMPSPDLADAVAMACWRSAAIPFIDIPDDDLTQTAGLIDRPM
jgi:hypothetical protein